VVLAKERRSVEVHWKMKSESLLSAVMELQRSDSGNASVDRLRLSLLGENIFQRFDFPIPHVAILIETRLLRLRLRRRSE
jgi:hypothetical protein